MGLEAPLALLGLCAALLPWLAHRIRRRDLSPVPLPTLALLRRAEAQKRRSRGLADLLLLAVRIAIVAAASLAISAPYATASLSFGDGSVASAAIVIDDSQSMMRHEGGETLLALAVERARHALASLPEGSEVALIAAGQRARVLARRGSDLALARIVLDRLPQSSARAADLKTAIKLAVQQLDAARHPTRRLLVLSDFASHTRLTPEEVRFDGVQVVLQRIGSVPPPANLYFTSVRALPDPAAKGQTSIAIELAAFGETPESVPLSVRSAGRTIASASLRMVAGRAREVIEVPTPDVDSDPTAQLRIDATDAIDVDNTAGALLRASDAVQVMLVNGDPHPASDRDELHYATRALRLVPSSEGTFALRTVDASALAKYDLTLVDVVVLANAEPPDADTARRLVHFVQQGGGLIVSAGDHVQPHAYNAALGEVLPCRIRARAQGAEIALAAPSASKLLPDGPSGLAQAKARKRLMMDCDATVDLRFADGTPALAESTVGHGRSALLAVSLDADWSDWPLRPGYLPLLARLIRQVSGAGAAIEGPVAAGSSVELAVPKDAAHLEVVDPEGTRRRYDDLKGKESVSFEATESPGAYRVLAASERGTLADVPRAAFVVESPHGEGDLTPLADVESWGVHGKTGIGAGYVKRSLSSYVLLVFAGLMLLEGALRLRRR